MSALKGKKHTKRKKPLKRKRKTRPKKTKQPTSKGVRYRTLIAILMLLYMLRLLDTKTFKKMTVSLYPRRKVKRRKRRKGK